MRWSIIRLICARELRDQLRDRRTVFMIAVLPLLLYPILGMAVVQFALGFAEKPSVVGIVAQTPGAKTFPGRLPPESGKSPLPAAVILQATSQLIDPSPYPALITAAVAHAGPQILDYPPLIVEGQFNTFGQNPATLPMSYLLALARVRIVFVEN